MLSPESRKSQKYVGLDKWRLQELLNINLPVLTGDMQHGMDVVMNRPEVDGPPGPSHRQQSQEVEVVEDHWNDRAPEPQTQRLLDAGLEPAVRPSATTPTSPETAPADGVAWKIPRPTSVRTKTNVRDTFGCRMRSRTRPLNEATMKTRIDGSLD
jgi:hypothetical protein